MELNLISIFSVTYSNTNYGLNKENKIGLNLIAKVQEAIYLIALRMFYIFYNDFMIFKWYINFR